MKRIVLFAAALMVTIAMASCKDKEDVQNYKEFVGTWGVEQLDYYNIDYAGAPIESSRETFYFTPGDMEGGIDLVFRDDKTGEMRDRSIDTFFLENENTHVVYDTIINPDTTVYSYFDYSYDAEESVLFMTMSSTQKTHRLRISNFSHSNFSYMNEYRTNFIEEAKLVRTSDNVRVQGRKNEMQRPRKTGSILSDR